MRNDLRTCEIVEGQMLTTNIYYGLLVALAIAVTYAAVSDIRSRTIANWLNAGIALLAPVFWWASGMALWPDIALQLGVAVVVFACLCGLFAVGGMGGGDVKLITALALWIEPLVFLQFLLVMVIAGALLSIIVGIIQLIRGRKERLSVPYGVAIAVGALWVLYPKLAAIPGFA